MQQIAKCHEFQGNMVVENVETLDVGWCVCVCVCFPRWAVGSLPGLFWSFGLVYVWHTWSRSLAKQLIHFLNRAVEHEAWTHMMHTWCTHDAHTLGSNRYAFLTAGRNWYVPNKSSLQQVDQNFVVMHCHCSNDITYKYFVYFYFTLLYQMRKFRSFV